MSYVWSVEGFEVLLEEDTYIVYMAKNLKMYLWSLMVRHQG
jgi:hypothetical protein